MQRPKKLTARRLNIVNGCWPSWRSWKKSSLLKSDNLNTSQTTDLMKDTPTKLDLKPEVPLVKANLAAESKMLERLAKEMNQWGGVGQPPATEAQETKLPAGALGSNPPPSVPVSKAPEPVEDLVVPDGATLFFTGRMKAGKDFCASVAGCKIFGFADPLYLLSNFLFGTSDKTVPGVRQFLQKAGQWGRGTVNSEYPLTTERAVFIQLVRALGRGKQLNDPLTDWENYGKAEGIWLNSCVARVTEWRKANPTQRVAISNVRFVDEYNRLRELGWRHWHILCSPKTWEQRLAVEKLTLTSPEVRNYSEQFAIHLDADVHKKISGLGSTRFHVVWSDPAAPPMSTRVHTVSDFLRTVKAEH